MTEKANWYVVYTKYRSEKKIANDISTLGFECYLPTYKTLRMWGKRKKKLELPLFPCYLFVRTTLQRRKVILSVKNVFKFVSFEKSPTIVSDEDIANIKTALNLESADIREEDFHFSRGTKVRINSGQFCGLEGIITDQNNNRLVVSIDGLQKAFSLNITAKIAQEVGSRQ
jgi:transcription antitermination factor NusG